MVESMGKKPRRRRSSTPNVKAEIVSLCQQGDRSVGSGREELRPDRDLGRVTKAFRSRSLAIATYGTVEWINVAVCFLVVPDALTLPLTHACRGCEKIPPALLVP
jgi:hypothetical protein